ncbi:DNA oxidative demethylase ALKBH2 isoform X1 [Lampetra planeri]
MMHSPYFGSAKRHETRSAAGVSAKVQASSGSVLHSPRPQDSPVDGKAGKHRQSHGCVAGGDMDSQPLAGMKWERNKVRLDPELLLLAESGSAIHIRGDGLACDYTRAFRRAEADRFLEECEKQIEYMADEDARVRVFGAWHSLPRQQSAYGDPGVTYRYSGSTLLARPWCPVLEEIREHIESLTEQPYNFVLVNRYRDGRDHMGEHRDDEKDLVRGSAIASVSLGACRDFCFRRRPRGGRRSVNAKPRESRGCCRDASRGSESSTEDLSSSGTWSSRTVRNGGSDDQDTEQMCETSDMIHSKLPKLDNRSGAFENDSVTSKMLSTCQSSASKLKCTSKRCANDIAITVSGDRLVMLLEHGSVLVMKWPTNEVWCHALPPRRRDKSIRVNLTFRLIHTGV